MSATVNTKSVPVRIPDWVADELYEIQHAARRAKTEVPSIGDLLAEAWEQSRSKQTSGSVDLVASGLTGDDLKLARKFLKWFHKRSDSPTHKGLVELIAMELHREK